MSIESMSWTKLTPEQAEVVRCLAEWGRYEERPLSTKLAETCEVDPGVASTTLTVLDRHGLLKVSKGKRRWNWVEMDPKAAQYIKENPYLGMEAGEAILAFLEDNGAIRGTRGVAAQIARGTGYHNTTISGNLQKLAASGAIQVERNGKLIIAAGLSGQEFPDEVTEVSNVYPLTPAEWLEEQVSLEDVQADLHQEAVEHSIKLAEQQAELRALEQDFEPFPERKQTEPDDYDAIARALLNQLIEKLSEESDGTTEAEAQRMVEQIANLTIESTEKGVRIRTLEQQLADGGREYDKLRAKYNELQGRFNAMEEQHRKLREQTREFRQEVREKKYPIPEEAKNKLAALMKEIPGVGR